MFPAAPDYAALRQYAQLPIFRRVPVLAAAFYCGIKRQNGASIRWPAQRDYPRDQAACPNIACLDVSVSEAGIAEEDYASFRKKARSASV